MKQRNSREEIAISSEEMKNSNSKIIIRSEEAENIREVKL